MNRISWDDKFFAQALIAAQRSHDVETQCGCVLVNETHEIVSEGFNGHIRNIREELLPTKGPDKYPYMIHAEQNALYSCARRGMSTMGCSCYITTIPCVSCYQALWQAGIKELFVAENLPKPRMCLNKDYEYQISLLQKVMDNRMPIHIVEFNLDLFTTIKNKYDNAKDTNV